MPIKLKPSYVRSFKAWASSKLGRKRVALKRPFRTTFKAKAYLTRRAAFGQKSYAYRQLRRLKARKW